MNVMQRIVSGLVVLGLVGASPASAAVVGGNSILVELATSVQIDDVVLSRCGTQTIFFSGTAKYNPALHHVEVQLDGSLPVTLTDGSFVWIVPFIVTPGAHTLMAKVYLGTGSEALTTAGPTVLASDSLQFNVAPCPSSPEPQSSSGGGGDGPDCCPGPDVVTLKKGKVLGLSTSTLNNKLIPHIVEKLFRQVFKRAITHQESLYWKKRARSDKPTEAALLRTMQWYKLQGKTTGK